MSDVSKKSADFAKKKNFYSCASPSAVPLTFQSH